MFKKALIRLTVLYSLLFLLLFWIFSFGIYFWMEHSFGEGYISKVKQVQQQQQREHQGEFDDSKTTVAVIAGDVALNQLRNILLIINGVFFVIIPLFSFYLARKTLKPIEETHEQQKQFVSDASHELKTPLSIMKGELEVSLQKKRSAKQYEEILNSNKEEVNRLIYLVENLLFLNRVDQKQNAFQKSMLDLTDLINTVIAKLQSKLKKKKLTLHFTPPQDNRLYLGQEVLLSQLLFNLIDNAIKYTHEKGNIWIRLAYIKQKVVIEIKDDGICIPANQLEKIFDRFYRIDPSRSQIKGYGLGLAIAKAIVRKHNGEISVVSEEGMGTTFTLTFPCEYK